MKIVIGGVSYGLEESVNRATLGDLYRLKKELGVSIKSIKETFGKFGELSSVDLLDDLGVLLDLQGVIWLSRRKAGEDASLEDAGDVSFDDIAWETEDDDEDAPDPKA